MHAVFTKRTWFTLYALAIVCACASPTEPAANSDALPTTATPAAFELMSVAPDVALPLWVRSPIVLSFSAPLDAASVSSGVRLETAAGPVAFTHRLEGASLTLEISTPPLAPSTLTLSVSADLRDQTGRAAPPSTRSWQLPLWRTSAADGASGRAPLVARGQDATWLAWETDAGTIQIAQDAAEGLKNLEPLPTEAGARLSDFVIDSQGNPVVAWRGAAAHVARFAAGVWEPLAAGLDAPLVGELAQPRLALGDQDTIVVAWPGSAGVELASWSLAGPWQPIAPALQPTAAVLAVDVAWSAGGAWLAALVDNAGARDLQVQRFEAGAWRAISEAVDHNPSDEIREFAIAVSASGVPHIAWTEVADGTNRLYVSRFASDTGVFQGLGPALNVGLDNHVSGISLAAGDGTAPVVAFQELAGAEAAGYIARWNGASFEVLGGSLGGRGGPALALGRNAEPVAATARADTGAIELHHYNESPAPPFGLSERKPQPCTLPPDSDPAFPKQLSQTGCYTNLPTQALAEGWITYDLNSPLWSDGAHKRRFFSIPADKTIGFTKTDAWEMPVGTMLGKEFWLQRDPNDPTTRYIVETRLMIKRCEPGSCRASWQGYSYQWNASADEATLLDNLSDSAFVDWPVASGMHTHSYPGRDECTRCHALTAGGALGPRTQQLNRNHRYGEVVDNQLRALFHAGLFGNSEPPPDVSTLFRLPTPSDPSYDLNARVRGYFDANCSHCHSPTSRWPVVDLRYDAPLRAGEGMTGNICNMLVPGNAEASILWVKLDARPGAVPEGFPGDTMPPIGRLLPDEPQVARIKSWIEHMPACP